MQKAPWLAQVLKRLHHLTRVRWWKRAITALYLTFAVQEVMQGDLLKALTAVAISALFLVTPIFIFKGLPLVVHLGVVIFGCWLVAMFLKQE